MRYFLDKKIDWDKPNYITRENLTRVLTCFYIDKLPRAQYLCLQYIFRRTYGHNKTKEIITVKHFLEGIQDKKGNKFYSGLNIGRTTLINSLKELHQAGLINRYKIQLSRGFIYEYKLNIENLLEIAGVNTVRNSKKEQTNLPETENQKPPKVKLQITEKKFDHQGTKTEPCQGTKTEPIKNNKYINIFIKVNNKNKEIFDNFNTSSFKWDRNINTYLTKKKLHIFPLNLKQKETKSIRPDSVASMAPVVNVYSSLEDTIKSCYKNFHGVDFVFGAKERSIADNLRRVLDSLDIESYSDIISFAVENWNAVLKSKFYWMDNTDGIQTFSIGFFLKYINEFLDYYNQNTKLNYYIQGDDIHNYIYKLMRKGVDKDTAIKRASCVYQMRLRDSQKEQDIINLRNDLERDIGEFEFEKYTWGINNAKKLQSLEDENLTLKKYKEEFDLKIKQMQRKHTKEIVDLKKRLTNSSEGDALLKDNNTELKEQNEKLKIRLNNAIELTELDSDSKFVSVPVREGTRWTTKKVRRTRLTDEDLINILENRKSKKRRLLR